MGYRTCHVVTASDESMEDAVLETLAEKSGYSVGDLQGEGTIKWYEHDEDCVFVSKLFPDLTLRVDGTGEEATDVWVSWYRNGRASHWCLDAHIPEGFERDDWD